MHKLMVCGSRHLTHYTTKEAMQDFIWAKWKAERLMVLTGGARGPDSQACEFARLNKMPVCVIYPDWERLGKQAGILRNLELLDMADEVLAIWDGESIGTAHVVAQARRRGLPLTIINADATIQPAPDTAPTGKGESDE